jgi:hypothetical protein
MHAIKACDTFRWDWQVEQQNSALQAKQEELSLQKDRLQKIQVEAEANERRVRELDTRLRMSEDANRALQVSARQHDASLELGAAEKSDLRAALRRTEEQLDKMHSQVSVASSFVSDPTGPAALTLHLSECLLGMGSTSRSKIARGRRSCAWQASTQRKMPSQHSATP